jgi:hypothetical protein
MIDSIINFFKGIVWIGRYGHKTERQFEILHSQQIQHRAMLEELHNVRKAAERSSADMEIIAQWIKRQ